MTDIKKPWTIEAFMRNWLGKNEVLSEARNYQSSIVSKLEAEKTKQERKLKDIDKHISKLSVDKAKIVKLISELSAEKASLKKG